MMFGSYKAKKQKKAGRSKYGALPTGGYASRREQRRACELRTLLQLGLISDLREQVKYQLIPAQYIDGRCVERACSYIADFVYFDREAGGRLVVEDSKGYRTPEYIIKRKLMLFIHGIAIHEV